jgi:hypothetical protein
VLQEPLAAGAVADGDADAIRQVVFGVSGHVREPPSPFRTRILLKSRGFRHFFDVPSLEKASQARTVWAKFDEHPGKID